MRNIWKNTKLVLENYQVLEGLFSPCTGNCCCSYINFSHHLGQCEPTFLVVRTRHWFQCLISPSGVCVEMTGEAVFRGVLLLCVRKPFLPAVSNTTQMPGKIRNFSGACSSGTPNPNPLSHVLMRLLVDVFEPECLVSLLWSRGKQVFICNAIQEENMLQLIKIWGWTCFWKWRTRVIFYCNYLCTCLGSFDACIRLGSGLGETSEDGSVTALVWCVLSEARSSPA